MLRGRVKAYHCTQFRRLLNDAESIMLYYNEYCLRFDTYLELYKSVTDPPKQRRNRYKESPSYQRYFSSFIMSKVHNSSSKDDAFSQMNQAKILTSTMEVKLNIILKSIPKFHKRPLPYRISTRMLCTFHIICATCPAHFILPDFVTVMCSLCKGWKPRFRSGADTFQMP